MYVDDCVVLCSNIIKGKLFVDHLASVFKIKVTSQPKVFSGVQLRRLDGCRILNQSVYIEKLARKFRFNPDLYYDTPMEHRLAIKRTGDPSEHHVLRALIGGLLFIACNTRPDIMFAVNYLSLFLSEGTPLIFKYAMRILSSFHETRHYSLDDHVVSFVDAAFADARDSKYESTGGYLIFCYDNLVAWSTRKQKRTSTSPAEAEYTALNDAVK